MNNILLEQCYHELIQFLKKDNEGKVPYLHSTTKLWLTDFCLRHGKDWKKDLGWKDDEVYESATRPIPFYYKRPQQIQQYLNLFCVKSMQDICMKDPNVKFVVCVDGKWYVDTWKFIHYLAKSEYRIHKKAQRFLQSKHDMEKLKEFLHPDDPNLKIS